jgi:hypothetical protein
MRFIENSCQPFAENHSGRGTCVSYWALLHLSAHQDMAFCSCPAGALMVGDTLFRSSDGSSHCPVCKGKVSFRTRRKCCLLPYHPIAVSIMCWHMHCPLTASLEESHCMIFDCALKLWLSTQTTLLLLAACPGCCALRELSGHWLSCKLDAGS